MLKQGKTKQIDFLIILMNCEVWSILDPNHSWSVFEDLTIKTKTTVQTADILKSNFTLQNQNDWNLELKIKNFDSKSNDNLLSLKNQFDSKLMKTSKITQNHFL